VGGLVKLVNPDTGRESKQPLAFGDLKWGQSARGYLASANGLSTRAWDQVIQTAELHVTAKPSDRGGGASSTRLGDDEEDERALLVNLSDVENSED
jgi:hypothetical protein